MALSAFRIPHPTRLSGEAALFAVWRIASRTCIGWRVGFAERTSAATPAESGHEKDVPFALPYPVVLVELATRTPCPIAMISGLILAGTSVVGPTELKLVLVPVLSTAPAVMTLSPSAGAPSVLCEALNPALPAELTTTTPSCVAISAARVMSVVFPSMFRYVQLVYGGSYVRYPSEVLVTSTPRLSAHSIAAAQLSSSIGVSLE